MLTTRLRGFILVELLVAITIIGMIIAAAAISLTNSRITARDAQRLGDGLTISKAIEGYAATERGQFPQSGTTNDSCAEDLKAYLKPYMPSNAFPVDPKPATPGASSASYQKCYFYSKYKTTPTQNLAAISKANYVLQIGLEKSLPPDDASYRTESELKLNYATSSRTPVYLVGQLCSAGGCN